MPSEAYEIAIIGAGPAGLAAGAQAAARGVSHVLLERSALANTIVKYQKGKHVMDEPPQLELRKETGIPFRAGSREQVLEGFARGTKDSGTNLLSGPAYEVVKLEGENGGFRIHLKEGEPIVARTIVLSIGMQGNLRGFGVPGDSLPHVGYQLDDPDEFFDKDVVVVGAGDAAIENAAALAKQNEVSIVNRGDEFPRAKPGNRTLIDEAIRAGRIRHYVNSEVKRFEERCVWLETPDGEVRVPADLVIGRLGASPPRRFLESAGIEFPSDEPGAIPHVSQTYESNVPGIYLVGAIAGYPLIKHCINQGWEVVESILGNEVEPADEPLLRQKFEGIPGTVNEILDRIRATLPVFGGLTNIQLREFLVDSSVHRLKPGDVVFERNEFSNSFYSILEGSVEVIAPASDADREAGVQARERRFAVGRGQYFGEMGLLSGRRRSATVVAREKCILIETPRHSMNKLVQSVPSVKRAIDVTFILRNLEITFGAALPRETLAKLAAAADIQTYKQGRALFEEGNESDGLHLIRRGSVTVARQTSGRSEVLAYLSAGNVVGEMALLSPGAKRTATVRANVLTETIRVPPETIRGAMESSAEFRRALETLEEARIVENVARQADRRAGDLISFLMRAGGGEATDLLLIDESLCVRCNNCEIACAETHGGVSRLDREAGPTFGMVHIPTSCRHCENPKCMTDCPPDAIRRHPTGEVYIMDNCIGCGNCAANCPYDVIQMAAVDAKKPPSLVTRLLFGRGRAERDERKRGGEHKKATKCDLCRDLPGAGPGRTACVASCPTGAILRVNPKDYVQSLTADF